MNRRRHLANDVRYFVALLRRFRTTALVGLLLFGVMPLLYHRLHIGPDGHPVSLAKALRHVYFLLYGQPSLDVDEPLLMVCDMIIPPLGIAVLVDGVVRFAYLFFARHKHDKEWLEVIAETMKGHVVVCGAGRVGYRVVAQLIALGKDVVVVEKRAEAAFVAVLRDERVPLLIDDIRSPQCLPRTNVRKAAAIVCATDDDLANLNIALDARRMNPDIRVVIRLFDDDLVAKVRDTFKAEALSSSSLAAPAMALAALDPRIIHSFRVGTHLMVVSVFEARQGLPGMKVSEVRDLLGGLTLAMRRQGSPEEKLHPPGSTLIATGDLLTLQAEYEGYRKLRAFTQEEAAPTFSPRAG